MDNGRKALVFLYILIHIFAVNITRFIRLVLTFPFVVVVVVVA